jgi:hypothetical protein
VSDSEHLAVERCRFSKPPNLGEGRCTLAHDIDVRSSMIAEVFARDIFENSECLFGLT